MCFFFSRVSPRVAGGEHNKYGEPPNIPKLFGVQWVQDFPKKPHWFPLVLPTCPPTIARQHGAAGTDRDAGSWSHRLLQMFKTPRFWASLAWTHLYPTVIEYLSSSFIIIHHHHHHLSSSIIICHHLSSPSSSSSSSLSSSSISIIYHLSSSSSIIYHLSSIIIIIIYHHHHHYIWYIVFCAHTHIYCICIQLCTYIYIYITLFSLNLTYHTRRVVTNYCAQRYWYCYAPIVLLPWCWLPWWLSFCRPTQTPVMMSLIERPLQRRSWHSAGEHPPFDPPIIFTITYIQRWLWWLSHIFPWTLPIFPLNHIGSWAWVI